MPNATTRDFARGYFCAVATLIKMNGIKAVEPDAKELFKGGGDPSFADTVDQTVFIEAGLMPPYLEIRSPEARSTPEPRRPRYSEGQMVRHNVHEIIVLDEELSGGNWEAHVKGVRCKRSDRLIINEEHILESVSPAQWRLELKERAKRAKVFDNLCRRLDRRFL